MHIADFSISSFIADFNTLLNNIQDNTCNSKNFKLSHSFDRYGNVLDRSFFSKTVVYRNRNGYSRLQSDTYKRWFTTSESRPKN